MKRPELALPPRRQRGQVRGPRALVKRQRVVLEDEADLAAEPDATGEVSGLHSRNLSPLSEAEIMAELRGFLDDEAG